MKNLIFLRLYMPLPHTFEEKYVFTRCIEEFYKLLNNFSHYTYIPLYVFQLYNYYRQNLSMNVIYLTTKTYTKKNVSNTKKERKKKLCM